MSDQRDELREGQNARANSGHAVVAGPQLNFLDYPHWPGFRARETSKAAADSVAPKAANLRERALFEIRLRRDDGLTADETAHVLGQDVLTIRPRIAELARMNLIRDSGNRRKNKSGKSAIVWVRS